MVLNRIPIAALSLSAAALVGLVLSEGYTDKAVIPVPGDVPTIGFGTTEGVRIGDVITPHKALQRAFSDVQKYEGAIKQCVKVPLYQWEYDAYINLAYNVGTSAFCKSQIVYRLNSQDYSGACQQILRWRFFQGKDCAIASNRCSGLWKRRQNEYKVCMNEGQ